MCHRGDAELLEHVEHPPLGSHDTRGREPSHRLTFSQLIELPRGDACAKAPALEAFEVSEKRIL